MNANCNFAAVEVVGKTPPADRLRLLLKQAELLSKIRGYQAPETTIGFSQPFKGYQTMDITLDSASDECTWRFRVEFNYKGDGIIRSLETLSRPTGPT